MAVPDRNDFTLQDVVDEVGPQGNDLAQCFNDANASKFDPAYSGSKNSLLNFRNYNECKFNVITLEATNVTPSSAKLGLSILSPSGISVNLNNIYYSFINPLPTGDDSTFYFGRHTTPYTKTATVTLGLLPNKLYYARAWVSDSGGCKGGYGNVITFNT